MTLAVNEMLEKMKKEPEPKEKRPVINPEETYSKLRIFSARRHILTLAVVGFWFFAFSLVCTAIVTHQPWMIVALPIVIAGAIMCLVPPSEEWLYKPWQSNPRQYEKHQIER